MRREFRAVNQSKRPIRFENFGQSDWSVELVPRRAVNRGTRTSCQSNAFLDSDWTFAFFLESDWSFAFSASWAEFYFARFTFSASWAEWTSLRSYSLMLWIWNPSSIPIPYLRNNKKKSKLCQSNEFISRFWKIKYNDGQIRRRNRMATILKLLFICGYENSRFLMQDRRPKHVLHGCDEPTGYPLAWSSLS